MHFQEVDAREAGFALTVNVYDSTSLIQSRGPYSRYSWIKCCTHAKHRQQVSLPSYPQGSWRTIPEPSPPSRLLLPSVGFRERALGLEEGWIEISWLHPSYPELACLGCLNPSTSAARPSQGQQCPKSIRQPPRHVSVAFGRQV